MHVVAIDPGLTGAIALVASDGTAEVRDMPTVHNRVDALTLRRIIAEFYTLYGASALPGHIWLELSQPMPGQGVVSTYRIGENYGCLLGLIATQGWRYTEVRPTVWKKALHLVGKDKEMARMRAQQLFPHCDLHRKKDHNRAEALLLGWYGLQQLAKEPS